MSKRLGILACTAFVLGSTLGACGSENVSGDQVCDPGELEDCTCASGDDGQRRCEPDGKSFGECDCSTTPGSGGAGGSDIGAGGSGGGTGGTAGGTGGTGGGSGGTLSDAGPLPDAASDAAVTPDAASDGAADADPGPGTDAAADGSVPEDASSAPDASPNPETPDAADASSEDPCTACVVDQCFDEIIACDEPDPCTTADDAGVSDSECMFECLFQTADPQIADVEDCADICGAGGSSVSPATRNLFRCLFGNGIEGAGCRSECGF